MSGTTKMQILILPDEQLMFDWDRAFVNTNINEKVFILNNTILNILSNFIPHKILTIDDKEHPCFIKK